ncbi:unnamed protein product [Lepeophtheirus salmonis]|uniref:(salmon louse) hypothetical protein n=1 Tax=Lepeophtheirus salmonis TaxID=72036 RepID=A0A7R8CU70_LEPSM|nr:unnamed protein product [Lepeophtheirus salmonis]CAF2897283.1 unnamed protein product [Lepeophtheirus salmonis]
MSLKKPLQSFYSITSNYVQRYGSSYILPSRESILREHWKKRQREYLHYLKVSMGIAGIVSCGAGYFMWQDKKRRAKIGVENIEIASTARTIPTKNHKFTAREKRFLQFSSVEYCGPDLKGRILPWQKLKKI